VDTDIRSIGALPIRYSPPARFREWPGVAGRTKSTCALADNDVDPLRDRSMPDHCRRDVSQCPV
jgi:hypothetical protein